jgi:SAM-dependent methyltransferase
MISKTLKFSVFELPRDEQEADSTTEMQFKAIFKDLPEDPKIWKSSSTDTNLTYGEITGLESLNYMFRRIRKCGGLLQVGGSFYDLGSGTGKPVIAAALLHRFSLSCGIEVVTKLYTASLRAKMEYDKLSVSATEVIFLEGSFLNLGEVDWTTGDVVCANSTCFSKEMMKAISTLASHMRPGAFFISLTHPLDESAGFEIIEEERLEVSWGGADFYLQRKLVL